MRRILLSIAFVAAGTSAARAEPPERLLFAGTQVYARWDGVAAHRDAYAQVTIGKLLSDELAPLVKSLKEQYARALQSGLVDEKLLTGSAPDVLAAIQAEVVEAAKAIDVVVPRGLVLGVEIGPVPGLLQMALGAAQGALQKQPAEGRNPIIPRIRATVIVPGGARDATPLLNLIRLYARSNSVQPTEQSFAARMVLQVPLGEFRLLAWREAEHFVVELTNETPAALFTRLDGTEARLDTAPLFKRLIEGVAMRTDFRAFVDVRSLTRMGRQAVALAGPAASQKFEALGLENIEHLLWFTGFDGGQRREVVEVSAPGPRKGLARVFGREPLSHDSLPPLPPDASKWSAHRIDPQAVYDLLLSAIDLARVGEDDPKEKAESSEQLLDKALAISTRSDLFDVLGNLFVTYHAPTEGGFTLGQVAAIQVKDGERVLQAVDQIIQGQIVGNNMRVKKRPFLDADIRELTFERTRGIVTPSYAVYKNWLVFSMYPQPVQGFIQRAAGKAPPWQSAERLAMLPRVKDCTSWAFNDPRSGAQQILTFGPIIIGAASLEGNGEPVLESGVIPSGSALMHRLTPNVTAMTDDGTTIRWDTRGGLLLLGDALGVEPVMLFLSAQILGI